MIEWRSAWRAWRSASEFSRQPDSHREICFYSEGRPYWGFLRPLIEQLLNVHNRSVSYLSSDQDDPGLVLRDQNYFPFYVGSGGAMLNAFNNLRAGLMVMTVPDLDKFHLKRSVYPVHYCYIHHSMVSTHMIYREGAFDAFDTIFCVGPHHQDETRQWENLRGLANKNLVEHGYGPLDDLIAKKPSSASDRAAQQVLLAPSWSPHGLLETCGEQLIGTLLGAGFQVVLRPHPRTVSMSPDLVASLTSLFQDHDGFSYEPDTSQWDAYLHADIMISDWSGSAMEFAFGLERPVLFVDVDRKVNNPAYGEIDAIPIEASYREKVGEVVSPNDISSVPTLLRDIVEKRHSYVESIRSIRDAQIYNVGNSASVGAARLIELAARNPVPSLG